MIYTDAGWFAYDECRWREDEDAAVDVCTGTGRIVQREAAELERQAAEIGDDDKRDRVTKSAKERRAWAKQSESEPRVRRAMKLARYKLKVDVATLDADPYVLNCMNGTLDLRTGELRPHRREDWITMLCPVDFDPEARSERWDRFLLDTLPDDAERACLQRAAGCSLLGADGEDKVLLLHGPTRAGKGTYLGALTATLGDYAKVAGLDTFADAGRSDPSRARPELVRLRGSRFVSVYETKSSLQLDAAIIKTVSGGDPITARGLFKEEITFTPQLTLWIGCNFRPELPSDDTAALDRVLEIPFLQGREDHEQDRTLRRELRSSPAHHAAILAWVVRGCLEYQKRGLDVPQSISNATSAFRDAANPFAKFFRDELEFGAEFWTATSEILTRLGEWRKRTHAPQHSEQSLYEQLRRRGCQAKPLNRGRGWAGVGLKHHEDSTAEESDGQG